MHTVRSPARQTRSPQILSARWNALDESPLDAGVPPEELFNSTISLAAVCPQTALMYAVLENAVLCFLKQFENENPAIPHTALEAGEWFFSDDSQGLFSFVSICTVLGLEPEFIRKRLEKVNPTLTNGRKKSKTLRRIYRPIL